MISRRGFLKLGASAAFAAPFLSLDELLAQDAKVETVVNNGAPESRYDFVFLPEGYTKNDRAVFDADVANMVKALDKLRVWQEYRPLTNVHKIWVPSDAAWSTAANGDGTAFGVTYDAKNNHPVLDDKSKRDSHKELAKAELPIILIKTDDKDVTGFSSQKGVITPANGRILTHEIGHGFDLQDEYRRSTTMNGLNCSADGKNPPWKELIGKVPGISTNRVKNISDEWYRGEKDDCLMLILRDGLDYGPLCTNGIITYFRRTVRPIDSAPKEDEPLVYVKGKPLVELTTNNSKTHKVAVQAWYCAGTEEQLEKAKSSLPEMFTPQFFKENEKLWKKTTVTPKGKGIVANATLSKGSYLLAVLAYDTNPAIILDSSNDTKDKRVYRLEVKE